MNRRKVIATSAIASLMAVGLAGVASQAQTGPAPKPNFAFEKCYGLVKAGKNDCQTMSSSCAGTSQTDAQADSWVYLPKGTCEKLVMGNLKPKT